MSSSKRKSGGGDANVRRAKSSRSLENSCEVARIPLDRADHRAATLVQFLLLVVICTLNTGVL